MNLRLNSHATNEPMDTSDEYNTRIVKQRFPLVAVIDFEATCVADPPAPPQSYIQEIIEFPIVIIDTHQGKIIDSFQSFCRPVIAPVLSDYCKNLTGITQEQVNNAPVFADVLVSVEKWLIDRNYLSFSDCQCLFVTDGSADFDRYLRMQCELANITYPKWAYQWMNVKKTFSHFYSTEMGRIAYMLEHLRIPLNGRVHSGLDDANNIGRIVIELITDGCLLMPNESYFPRSGVQSRVSSPAGIRTESSRLLCLNCGRCHVEDRHSCLDRSSQRQRNIQ